METRDGTGAGPKHENAVTQPESIKQSQTSPQMQKAVADVVEEKKGGTSSLQEKADNINHVISIGGAFVAGKATKSNAVGNATGAAFEYKEGVVSPEKLSNTLYENETKNE